jgi:hypothetical protein
VLKYDRSNLIGHKCKHSQSGHRWVFPGIDIPLKLRQKYGIVARWNLKPSVLCILFCMFFLMLLIVVLPDVDLPDVDLPDAAFHRGTAPLVVHTQATAGPPAIAVASPEPFLPATVFPFSSRRESRRSLSRSQLSSNLVSLDPSLKTHKLASIC